MTGKEACEKWNDACAARVTGAVVWMNGNREPITVALSRHFEATVEETELPPPRIDWKSVVVVKPVADVKTHFYLCVE